MIRRQPIPPSEARQRDRLNREPHFQALLDFDFNVRSFDHDFVTWNALLRWRPQGGARFQIEIRAVPGAGDLGALNVAFRQRSATVRASAADSVIGSLHIEEGYSLASECERNCLAWGQRRGLSYFDEVSHCAGVRLVVDERLWPRGLILASFMVMRLTGLIGRRVGDGGGRLHQSRF